MQRLKEGLRLAQQINLWLPGLATRDLSLEHAGRKEGTNSHKLFSARTHKKEASFELDFLSLSLTIIT